MRSRFSPSSWVVFAEVNDRAVQADIERLHSHMESTSSLLMTDSAFAPAIRVHEARHYHDYASGGGFSLLAYRLMRMRHASALHVLNAVLESTGYVVSLSRLVAESIYPTRQPGELVEHLGLGVDVAAHLAGWNSADQLLSALTGVRMPDDYLGQHWELFFTFYTDRLLAEGMMEPTPIRHAATTTRVARAVTTQDLLEHLAVNMEFELVSRHFGPEQTQAYCSSRRGFPESSVARAASDILGLPCPHTVIAAFAEAALFQVPDPELVDAVPAAFSEFAPGDIFVRLLAVTDCHVAQTVVTAADAWGLAISALDRIAPWHRDITARATELPPARELLDERDALVRVSDRPFEDGRSRAAVVFPLLTIMTALRARAAVEPAGDDSSAAVLTPPLIVTPNGLETYPPLTSDPRDFALFVSGCLSHLVIDELSRSATLRGASEMVAAIRLSHGDLVVKLVGLYLRPLLGEKLHEHVTREISFASTLAA